jgi:HK97 family phage portal protein
MPLTLRQFAAVKMLQWAGLTQKQVGQLAAVESRGGWWPILREGFTGAWQQNTEVVLTDVLTYAAVFRCIDLISSDVGKLRVKLVEERFTDIWSETDSPAFSPVLREPNHFQTSIQFLKHWVIAKLIWGNAFILKQRDNRGVVVALYVLDSQRVRPLVAPDSSVYYELKRDDLSRQREPELIIPASEIIHDTHFAPWHPLVGLSPISACGLAAMQGLRIQDNSSMFFENGSQPGGLISAPGAIPQAAAERLKAYFDTNFSGANRGKVAVVGDGLTYTPLAMVSATDAQLIEQLKWTAENVCTAFGVPSYMIGVGPPPNYNNIEALSMQYYTQCLQIHIESIESLLNKGLGLTKSERSLETELDLANLLRMDTATLVTTERDALVAGLKSVNEGRQRLNLPPVKGGETVRMQQQVFSLEALAERDQAKPFAKPTDATPATPAVKPSAASEPEKDFAAVLLRKMQPVIQRNATRAA